MSNQVGFLTLIFFSLVWAGCGVVSGIFETGFLSGIFPVALVVGCILLVITWLSKKRP